MKTKNKIKWLSAPEQQDYNDAVSYLSLIFDETQAQLFVDNLKKGIIVEFKAKDIFRASSLSLLGISNKHVNRDLKKIESKISLSPILLVRNSPIGKVIIADGYHRLCAVYSLDEDALIPCKII
ncbi:MAG: hypothetical protein WCQ95_14630 [Bacteroidota bacterium]